MILLDQRLESSLESVDHSEERAVALAQESGLSEEETYRLGYAVREALVNAVVHGNRYSANKVVHFKVTRTARAIEVVIEDQGSGFSTEMQGDPLAQENLMNQSGRGLALIRAFTDELQVERTTPGGTRVILRKFLPPEAG
jgi:serine/threonine-protein kinase RsbW